MTAAPGVEEIVRFLRRFSDLVSTGYNADHLLCAAELVETLIETAKDAEELLREEQARSEKNSQLLTSTAINCARFEKELGEVKAMLLDLVNAIRHENSRPSECDPETSSASPHHPATLLGPAE